MQGYGTVRFDKVETARKAIEEVSIADLEGRSLGFKMDTCSENSELLFTKARPPSAYVVMAKGQNWHLILQMSCCKELGELEGQ